MAMSYTEAFSSFGATLVNPQWAYSAIANDGSLVISCWSHKFIPENNVLVYRDRLSRWRGNSPGKNLLIDHLTRARDQALPVRLVIATTDQPDVVDRGEEASTIHKTFHIRRDLVGTVTLFDDDNFVIEFRRQ